MPNYKRWVRPVVEVVTHEDERIRQLQARKARIERIRALKERKSQIMASRNIHSESQPLKELGATDISGSVTKPFNKGLLDTLLAPADIVNTVLDVAKVPGAVPALSTIGLGGPTAAIAAIPKNVRFATDKTRELSARAGFTDKPGEESTGFIPRAMEILGASSLFSAAIFKHGQQVLQALKAPTQRTVVQNLAAETAKRPVASSSLDIGASFGASGGGEVAEKFTENPALISSSELAGGFMFPLTAVFTRIGLQNYIKPIIDNIDFSQAGKFSRASVALKKASGQPGADAAKIDIDSSLPPAMQIQNPRLLSVQQFILKGDPEMEAKFSKELQEAIKLMRRQVAEFEGADPNAPRDAVQAAIDDPDYITNLVRLSAAMKAEEAQVAINALGPEATPRQVSRVGAEKLNSAYDDGRAVESQLWQSIDGDLGAAYTGGRTSLEGIIEDEAVGKLRHIPDWLLKTLGAQRLSSGKIVFRSQNFGDAGTTYKDVHASRTRLQHEIRTERRLAAPDEDKIRLLSKIAGSADENLNTTGLLADMAAVDPQATKSALSYSRNFNQMFTQGSVGRLLGFRGPEPEDMLGRVLSGRTTATQTKEFLNAAPNARGDVEDFIKAQYASQVVGDGVFNPKAHARFIQKYEGNGLFDELPDLKRVLNDIGEVATEAGAVQEFSQAFIQQQRRSLASLYLDADVGAEMNVLLGSKSPVKDANELVRLMGGDQKALQGLKSNFVEAMMQNAIRINADGDRIFNAKAFNNIVKDNIETARALGMDSADVTRMRLISNRLVQAQTKPVTGKDVTEGPAMIVDFVATLLGAKAGQAVAGGGLGSSLKTASAGANMARKLVNKLQKNSAMAILIDAQTNPEIYKALLTHVDAPQQEVAKATQLIESWLLGAGVTTEQPRLDGKEPITLDGHP